MIDLLRCLKECQPFLTIRERVKCSHTNRLCADHEHIFEPTALLHCKPPLIPQNNTCHTDNYSFSELACLFEG